MFNRLGLFASSTVMSLGVAATSSVGWGQVISGPYEKNGSVKGDVPGDFLLTHDSVSFPAGSSVEFVPSAPVTFGAFGSVSFGYSILEGQTGGGVPRIFFELSGGSTYLILRPDYDPAFGASAGDSGIYQYNFAADGSEVAFENGTYDSFIATYANSPVTRVGLVHDFNSLSINYTDYTFTAVPEPALVGLMGMSGLLLNRRRRI